MRYGGLSPKVFVVQEVNTRTQALAQSLLGAHGCVPGQPVLLVFLPSLDFILAFIACLRAGLLAVPVRVPTFKF